MELHQRVPAEKWCITKSEFFAFVEDVREVWQNGRFKDLSCDADAMNQYLFQTSSKRLSRSVFFQDEVSGPDLYEVNEHFVKPLTSAAGGMSYALMKHPQGLLCEVFISHAWAEGIFELGDHVKRAWPRMHGTQNLYCCLLANPQNLDMSTFLNVPPEESPFARAMQCASHVLIIPNSSVGIYTRLWCVYEAYLGTQYQKTCIMPTRPRLASQCRVLLLTIVVPISCGVLSGFVLRVLPIPPLSLVKVSDAIFLFCFLTTALCFAFAAVMHLFKCQRFSHRRSMCIYFERTLHVLLMSLLAILFLPWMTRKGPYFSPSKFDHYYVLFGTWFFNVLRVAQLNEEFLADVELKRQATNLDFTTLADASCSNPDDEVRIRAAIAGFEHEVEIAIQILMKAGAYSDSLRKAYLSGFNIAGLGSADLVVKTMVASGLWILCASHSFAVYVLQDDVVDCSGQVSGYQSSLIQGHVSFALSTGIAVLLPFTTFLLARSGLERGAYAVRVWTIAATVALGIPALVEITEFLMGRGLWFLNLDEVQKYCPSHFVQFMLIWFPPITALCAFLMLARYSRLWFLPETNESSSGSSDSDDSD